MNTYKITVVYETHRNTYRIIQRVEGKNERVAKYLLLGVILNDEHNNKDRFIKIISVDVEDVTE